MSGWNRLCNGVRDALKQLPVWTTVEDRQRALAYTDNPLEGMLEALEAVQTGRPARANLGVILAVARYEDEGWMPDGCFEKWRRVTFHGTEELEVPELLEWLDVVESNMRKRLLDVEAGLMDQCRQEENNLAAAEARVAQAHQRLHAHHQKLILARLSVGDTPGAQEIVQQVPEGPDRDALDQILREHALGSSTPPANLTTSPAAATLTPPPAPRQDDLAAYELRHLNMTGRWLCSAPQDATLTPDDRRRLGQTIERALQELCRHRQAIRRKAEPCAEERDALEWLKQLMGSVAYRNHPQRPVLVSLAKRLLKDPR